MKQFLSSLLDRAKPHLVSALNSTKQFLSSLHDRAKQCLSSKFSNIKLPLSPKLCKLLVLIFVLILILGVGLSKCSGKADPPEEVPVATDAIDNSEADPNTEQPDNTPVAATMGTITADKLNIRKGPDSKYETDGAYYKGDRIEILETQTSDGTTWGRTNLGWIGMGYVRMDGVADTNTNPKLISNGNTTVLGYGVVDLKELNVRLGPDTDFDKVTTIKQGIRYAYYQVSNSSENWVRIEDGWVSSDHFYLEGSAADDGINGTVTTEELNIRTGPNTSFQSIGTYKQGETIAVLAQVGSWGYTEKGWVFMTYVEPNKPVYHTGTGTITSGLNIREESNADSEIIGTYTTGDQVEIIEVAENWGKTDKGWINLKYLKYD